jgi:DNA polymerase
LCSLHKYRTQSVFGFGNINADLVFVGEAPGADEDKQGKPFVGKAGKLLTKMIKAMGLSRKNVFITNILKCRPPDNRTPNEFESKICTSNFMNREIQLVKPKIIITLGKTATNVVLQRKLDKPLSQVRGKWYNIEGIWVMPTFHPAYLLRNANKKIEAWQDLKKVINRMETL